jgi:hypothetical protein
MKVVDGGRDLWELMEDVQVLRLGEGLAEESAITTPEAKKSHVNC